MIVIITILFQAFLAFLFGTVLFDVLHFSMHRWMKSNSLILKKIGNWHSVHHRFLPGDLVIRKDWADKNLFRHVTLEYFVQLCGIGLSGFFVSHIAQLLAMIFSSLLFVIVWRCRGADLHHSSYTVLPAYRGGFFVTANYHALHHVFPNNFFSSYIKLLDFVLGTGLQLSGRHVVMTGGNGALGSHMKKMLIKEGATVISLKFGIDYDYQNYEQLKPILYEADILFLCHGSKYDNAQKANCDSFIQLIELFKTRPKKSLIPLEVWGVGSEIECHPYFGIKKLRPYAESKRNYAKKARTYFNDTEIQYRHLVHSAFTSSMGPGLMSAKFAARVTMFFLKRGFRYIPVTYTGFALLNYFRFALVKVRSNP